MSEEGIILVITAPSGSGKTTIYRKLLEERNDLTFSVSCTTRKKRAGEIEGVDYYFIDRDEFGKRMEKGTFVEWAEVHGERYGTEKAELDRCRRSGKVCILDLDVQGALNIMKLYPEAVTIFIEPPSLKVLRQRLEARGTESMGDIEMRLADAEKELEYRCYFHYIVVNDRVENAVGKLHDIIDYELNKRR